MFLHPHGPEKAYKYPNTADLLVMSIHDILTMVNPSTATGRIYTLSETEMTRASEVLAARNLS